MVSTEPQVSKEHGSNSRFKIFLAQGINKGWEGGGGWRRNRITILFVPTWLTHTESMKTEFVCRSARLAGCLTCKLFSHVLGCTKGHRITRFYRPRWVKYLGFLLVFYRIPYTNTLFILILRNLIILTTWISLLGIQLRDLYWNKSCLKTSTSLCPNAIVLHTDMCTDGEAENE